MTLLDDATQIAKRVNALRIGAAFLRFATDTLRFSSSPHTKAHDLWSNRLATNHMTHETTHAGKKVHAPPAETVNNLAVEIRILNSIVTKLTMRDFEQRINETLPGISLLQFGVLRLLSREQLTLSELSAKMMLTPSTLVPAVDKLERESLVVRGKDPHDRRRTPLQLTDQARAALIRIPPAHPHDALVQAIHHLGEPKALHLHKLLRELLQHLMPERDIYEEIIRNHPDHCGKN